MIILFNSNNNNYFHQLTGKNNCEKYISKKLLCFKKLINF